MCPVNGGRLRETPRLHDAHTRERPTRRLAGTASQKRLLAYRAIASAWYRDCTMNFAP